MTVFLSLRLNSKTYFQTSTILSERVLELPMRPGTGDRSAQTINELGMTSYPLYQRSDCDHEVCILIISFLAEWVLMSPSLYFCPQRTDLQLVNLSVEKEIEILQTVTPVAENREPRMRWK
jgi:hypothetical protein